MTDVEKVKEFLQLRSADVEIPHGDRTDASFYEDFSLRGIRVDRAEPGFVSCSFKVPPRLTDRNGVLATGAIANLVDDLGGAVVQVDGFPVNVSIDMSISFFSSALANDELEMTAKILGRMGGYDHRLEKQSNRRSDRRGPPFFVRQEAQQNLICFFPLLLSVYVLNQ